MAGAFAISVPLLDSDLAQFIYAGRLSCKIDKVWISVWWWQPRATSESVFFIFHFSSSKFPGLVL